MTTQSQPGRKPFVFGVERSTSTTSSPERPQTFFDCLEEQDQRHDTSSGTPGPAPITAETRDGEAEERQPRSEAARTFNSPSATTANKFSRIGNGLEPFNIIGTSTGSGNAPSSIFGNPHPPGSEAAIRPSGKRDRHGRFFGVFGAPRHSTPAVSNFPSSNSGNTASNQFGNPPPAQTPGGLFSASATSNKREDQGTSFGPRDTHGSSSQFMKDPPSIFDLPPPQSGNTSSSLFGNLQSSNYGQTPSAPPEGTSIFGGATSARASDGRLGAPTPAQASGGLFGTSTPAQTSGGLFGPLTSAQSSGGLFGASAPARPSGGLFAGITPSNKHENGVGSFQWPNTRPPAQSTRDPPSVFNVPPPQAGNTSSSFFGNLQSNYGQSPSAPSEGTSIFGGATSAQTSGGLFGASTPALTSGGLFSAPTPAPTSGGLFGAPTPAQATGGLFGTSIFAQTLGASAPTQASGNLFGPTPPAQTSGDLFGAAIPAPPSNMFSRLRTAPPAQPSSGLFGAAIPAPSSNLFSGLQPAQTSGSPFGASTPALTSGGLIAPSAPAQASGASEAGAPPKLSGENLQSKADDAWTQQHSKIQLALFSVQEAQKHGQEAHNSFRQERDQLQDQIKYLEKQLEEKQARIVAMTEQNEKANEQANEQIVKMRRYYSGSGRPPSGTFNEDDWFFDCAANRKFGAMYACLRQMFSGESHPLDFLETIKPEDIWYDPFNLCLRREVLLKDGHVYLRKSQGPSVAPDAGRILAGPQVEKNQTQITDTFKPNIQPEVNPSDKKEMSDASNVVPKPAASGNGSKAKPAKDTMGKIIKGRHGRIMSLGPSISQTEEIPSLAKPSESSRTESTNALAGPTPTDENNNHIKPTPIRSRSDSTPLPIRGKRSSSARPTSKDENDSAKQTSTPSIRPLIKEEWLTNEQRVSRIRKEEDETVERAMLRKRQQKGQ